VALIKQGGGAVMIKVTIDNVEGVLDVKIGCQRTWFLTNEALLADLKEYLSDPDATQQKYFRYKKTLERRDKNECLISEPIMEQPETQSRGTVERAYNEVESVGTIAPAGAQTPADNF
jgi:hypothetical protein